MNAAGSFLPFVLSLGLSAVRWMPVVVLLPIFVGHAMPLLARSAIALAFALPVAPGLLATLQETPLAVIDVTALVLKEAGIGLLLAALFSVPFWAIEAAGTYLDFQRGGNPQAIDPAASADASVLGTLLRQSLVVYLIHAGIFHALLSAIYASYVAWPPLASLPTLNDETWNAIAHLLTAMMRFSLTLAFPYLLALGLIEACFAILSRTNPKFPAYVAALPFKSVVTVLLVALTLPILLGATQEIVLARLDETAHVMRGNNDRHQ
jgi:type III secretion protein T